MKKFILILVLILIAGGIAFHYIAANQAEKEIDKAIQQQVNASPRPLSVQYSSVEVSPFSGDVVFRDVTIIEGSDIERTRMLDVDLRYIDFLNIYWGGVESGLKKLTAGKINLGKTSYINRESLQEFSVDTLSISYHGNMWDALQSIFTERATAYEHNIRFTGARASYTKPGSALGNFKADTLISQLLIPEETTRWRQQGTHTITLTRVNWTPPKSFQNKYGFFIQGFGYPLDAIPVKEMSGSYTMPSNSRILLTNGLTSTDLFTAHFEGTIQADSSWSDARLNPLKIELVDLSQDFKNVLGNLEQLLGISIPGRTTDDEIHLQLVGPAANPRMQPTP